MSNSDSEEDDKTSKSDGGLNKVVQDMGVIGISRILFTIAGIILIPVLTKNLGAEGYGLWSQAIVTITISVMVLRLGTPLSIARLFPGKNMDQIREDLYSILTLVVFVTGLFSLILYTFPEPLADAIFEGNVLIVRIVAVIIFVNCLDKILMAVFQAFREMKKHAIVEVVSRYIEVGLAISLVLLGYGIIGAILSVLIVRGFLSIVLLVLIHNKIPFRKPKFAPIKEYIYVGLPATPGAISHLIVDMSDRYVIGIFLGATYVGYYAPSYALGMMIPTFIAGILAFVLLPNLSKFYENNSIVAIRNVFRLCTKYFLLISVPSLVGIIIVGKSILLVFTTPEIAQEGYLVLVLSSVVGILIGIYSIYKNTLYLKKRTKLFTVFWAVGATVNLVGNILLVPLMGIVAAGLTTILSYLIVTISVLYFSFKNIPADIDYLSIAKVIISSISMGFILVILNSFVWSNFVFLIGTGILVYFSILYTIKGINKKEIRYLKKINS